MSNNVIRPANNLWSVAIKVIILALLSWALYEQLISQKRLDEVIRELNSGVAQRGWGLVGVCVLLMFANWGLEAFKWNLLINKLVRIRYRRAFQAVWTGVTLGLFTPNRVGEYGGRILYLPTGFRISGVVSSLVGSYATILATLYAGLAALMIFVHQQEMLTGPSYTIVLFISGILLLVLTLAYYYLYLVVDLLRNRRIMRRLVRYIEVLSFYNPADFSRILVLSLLRFMVFSAQYLILLRLFGVHLQVVEGWTAVSVIFLAQTALPSFTVAELFTRGNISLYFLRFYTENTGAILAASTSLWLLNLIFPAVAGYFFILRKNFFKTRSQ